jgi:hypothetical protein
MAELEVSQFVVSAICGCWQRESGVNPAIWESTIVKSWDYVYGTDGSNQGGYGLGQWTNTRNPSTGVVSWRLLDMHNWFVSQGLEDGDGDGQLEYLLVENHWNTSRYSNGSPRLHCHSLEEFLNSTSQNLEDLVWDFLACWEGVAGNAYALRCTYARQILSFIQEHANDGVTYEWISGNRYLSVSETHNNAMVVFQRIGRIFPHKPQKNKMPLWMMCNRNRNKDVLF